MTSEVFVRLVDEDVDVWRPVRAEHVEGVNYRIVEQDYDREAEAWEFEPGSIVTCALDVRSDREVLIATRSADEPA